MPNWAFGYVNVTGTRDGIKSFIERFVSEDDPSTIPGKRFFARSFIQSKRQAFIDEAMKEFSEPAVDAETEARIKRLVESLSVASETSAKYVMEQIDELHRQSEQEQTRIAELEKLARQSNALSQNLFFYRDMIESFADTVDSTTIEERRRLLRTIVKKVVWDGKNVYVYLFAEDGELNLPPIGQLMCPSGEDSE